MQFSLDFYTPFRHAKTYKAFSKKYKACISKYMACNLKQVPCNLKQVPCIFAYCRLLKTKDLNRMHRN